MSASSQRCRSGVCLSRRYAAFGGRARRADVVWMSVLSNAITVSILGGWARQALNGAFSADADNPDLSRNLVAQLIACCVLQLAFALPVLAVQVRRLHDTDRSGLLVLVSAIPLGGLVLLVLLLMPGTAGDNRFGPDPRRPRPART